MTQTRIGIAALVLGCCVWAGVYMGCRGARSAPDMPRLSALRAAKSLVEPLHQRMLPPQPGDWLLSHAEDGQTFGQYVSCDPAMATGERKRLYILPLGEFDEAQRRVLELTADFMGRYFGLQVVVEPTAGLQTIPESARRVHPSWGDAQVLTTFVLHEVLKPKLPADAAAYIALTTSDLWPGEGWNFVFGQASLRERVGVWSMYRNGDPTQSEESFCLFLRRTLKTATHETGHMLSMEHCIEYECNLNGSNNREESDRHPLWLCPECMPKVCYATGCDVLRRYEQLAEFCRDQSLEAECAFYERSIRVLLGR